MFLNQVVFRGMYKSAKEGLNRVRQIQAAIINSAMSPGSVSRNARQFKLDKPFSGTTHAYIATM
jgi:hypothetical protein